MKRKEDEEEEEDGRRRRSTLAQHKTNSESAEQIYVCVCEPRTPKDPLERAGDAGGVQVDSRLIASFIRFFRWRIFLPLLLGCLGLGRSVGCYVCEPCDPPPSRHRRCRLSAAQVDNPWLSIFFRALLNQTLPLVVLLLLERAFSEPINEIIFHGCVSSK